MILHSRIILCLITVLSVICLSAPPADAEETLQLDTVTVTAEKRKGEAQDVAIPMSVISDIDIEDRNIREMSDLTMFAPNLQFSTNGRMDGGAFGFRGLGLAGMNVFTERSPLIVNIDGIPWGSRFGLGVDFSNVERIEFLRGPQGSLYGKNSMAGVINIVTKDPGNEFSGKVGFFAEQRNTYGADFQMDAPIVEDRLFIRLSGSYDKSDGWIEDHTPGGEENWNHSENKNLFMKLVAAPSERLKASFQYRFMQTDAGNSPYIVGTKDITYDVTMNFTDPSFERDTHDAALKLDYGADIFDVTSITTYRTTSGESSQYQSLSQYGGFDDANEYSLSQELRFASRESARFSWLAGVFLSKEQMERDRMGITMDYSYYGLGVLSDDWPVTIDTESYAAFGEVTFPVFTEKLKLTLGGRYEHVYREMDYKHDQTDYFTGDSVGYSYLYMADMPVEYDTDGTWSTVLGKAALKYEVNDRFMLYTSVAQGYMPGGFNYTMDEKEYAEFDAQKSVDYELGFKSMLFSNRLMLNANLFYTKYTDLQVYQQMSATQFSVSNAGEAHAKGIEMDFSAKAAKGLSIYGGLGILDAEYDDYEENQGYGAADYSGNSMTDSPDYTAHLGAKYRHPSGVFAAADYHRTGTTYFSKNNSSDYERDPYDLVNAKIGYESEMGIDVYLYARNLLDEEYFTGAIDIYNMYEVGEPRTFGVQVNYRF